MTLVRTPKAKKGSEDAAAARAERPPLVAYADDACAWALQQAAFLRDRRFDLIDADIIADEIDAVARAEMRGTRSALPLVLHHLLKWDHQPRQGSESEFAIVGLALLPNGEKVAEGRMRVGGQASKNPSSTLRAPSPRKRAEGETLERHRGNLSSEPSQPQLRSRSWTLSIREHRRTVARQRAENPGLQPQVPMMIETAYADARDAALRETGLPEQDIPLACPCVWDEIMTRPIDWSPQP